MSTKKHQIVQKVLHEQLKTWPVDLASAAVILPDAAPVVVHKAADDSADRVFHLASVTKLLTAYGVLVAIEEESLSLGLAVDDRGATLAHLLSHASGLGPDSGDPLAEPGERRIYSNAGFELLGEVLAEATGLPLATYLREAVLEPLAMSRSSLAGSPAHGGQSTIADLARFGAELLRPRLLARETLDAARAPVLPHIAGVLPGYGRQDPNPWGLGFEVRGDKSPHWTAPGNSAATFGHFGRSGTFLWIDPVADLGLAVLTDRDFGDWALDLWPALSSAVLDGFT